MGNSHTKFRRALQNGHESVCLRICLNNVEFRKTLDVNRSYNHNGITPLHYACSQAMKDLLQIFILDFYGNPKIINDIGQNCVHLVAMVAGSLTYGEIERRTLCMKLLLKWKEPLSCSSTAFDEYADFLNLTVSDMERNDQYQNTPLHYAAMGGLTEIVILLVENHVSIFCENVNQMTPCDIAEKYDHLVIAQYLESKMVFYSNASQVSVSHEITSSLFSGMRTLDVLEAKDSLLIETADMLHVPLFTAEALLRNHEWCKAKLLEEWFKSADECCRQSGVVMPDQLQVRDLREPVPAESPVKRPSSCRSSGFVECLICFGAIKTQSVIEMPCQHMFCEVCWNSFLILKIQEGEIHTILCPAVDCSILVPTSLIELLVPPDVAKRYLQFDIKAFVESNPNLKWCPYPGCGLVVSLDKYLLESTSSVRLSFSISVTCGNDHCFCWHCLEEGHQPCSCENWKIWIQKTNSVCREDLSNTAPEFDLSANVLWLVSNAKCCPHCRSPIQKYEGCNHVKCTKCKYEFCWVCLENWKKHSRSTGGYFNCNKLDLVKANEDLQNVKITEATEKSNRLQELNRFAYYFTRYKNHEHRLNLERPYLSSVKNKVVNLAQCVLRVDNRVLTENETDFLEAAIKELLVSRRILQCSYAYGYFLDPDSQVKIVFEFIQKDLEEVVETLSQTIARPWLKTTREIIIETVKRVVRKRIAFLNSIVKGLLPPEISPAVLRNGTKSGQRRKDNVCKSAVNLPDPDLVLKERRRYRNSESSPHLVKCLRGGCLRTRRSHSQMCSFRCEVIAYRDDDVGSNETSNGSEIPRDECLRGTFRTNNWVFQEIQMLHDAWNSPVAGEKDSSDDDSADSNAMSSHRDILLDSVDSAEGSEFADTIVRRALELSRISALEQEDADVLLAIKLSLKTVESDTERNVTADREDLIFRKNSAEKRNPSGNKCPEPDPAPVRPGSPLWQLRKEFETRPDNSSPQNEADVRPIVLDHPVFNLRTPIRSVPREGFPRGWRSSDAEDDVTPGCKLSSQLSRSVGGIETRATSTDPRGTGDNGESAWVEVAAGESGDLPDGIGQLPGVGSLDIEGQVMPTIIGGDAPVFTSDVCSYQF